MQGNRVLSNWHEIATDAQISTDFSRVISVLSMEICASVAKKYVFQYVW